MRSLDRCRPSPAMVVASIALPATLGGTSVAAVGDLPQGGFGTPRLGNDEVTSAKVEHRSLVNISNGAGVLTDTRFAVVVP